MNKSENFGIVMLACAVLVVALGLMQPRLVVLSGERDGVRVKHEVFAMRWEMGGRVFVVNYSSRGEE